MGQKLFYRKDDYKEETIEQVRSLISNAKKIGYSVLAIPGENSILCYYAGYAFAEIKDDVVKCVLSDSYEKYLGSDWENIKSDLKTFINNSNNNYRNLKALLDGVACAQPQEHERHTQHPIAVNNISYENGSYSVCGFETAIPSTYFPDKKRPEIDLVIICPDEHRMMLVEYKCTQGVLKGPQGVVAHGIDYNNVKEKYKEIGLVSEMIKAYNLMNRIYNGNARTLTDKDIQSIDIMFLLTGSWVKRQPDEKKDTGLSVEDNSRAIKMIKETDKLNDSQKNQLFWYWCENYEDVLFEKSKYQSLNCN
ncbi:MAG: hypothetical protein IJ712_02795 [Anaerovibrio sp.]|nr:hypothetical protein [Anaerovibrio sp.]